MRKAIINAIKLIEPQVIGLLKANGLIRPGSKTLHNAQLTEKAHKQLNMKEPIITDNTLAQWRNKWPTGKKGTKDVVRKKMSRFIADHDVTMEDINRATDHWLSEHEDPYCGNANNFFYVLRGDSEISRCEESLQMLKDMNVETESRFGDDFIIDPNEW